MPTVLVVDDDLSVRALLRDLLELEGYTVRTAPDGGQALAVLETARPDCVVLDVMMPGPDGFEVLARIRATDDGADLPVVMLTASADDAQAWRAWTEGVDYFLAKPFEPEALLRYLDYLFSAEAAGAAPASAPHPRW